MLRFSLVLLFFAIGSILAMGTPALAAGLFFWNNLFRPLEFSRHAGAFPAAYYVLGILLLSYFWNLIRGKFSPHGNFLVYAWLPFIGWIYLTTIISNYRVEAFSGFFNLLKYILPILLIATALQTEKDVNLVLAAIALSIGIWSAQAGVYSLLKGTMTPDVRIPGAQMSDNNDFMAGTVSTIPMLLYFSFQYRGIFRKGVKTTLWVMSLLGLIGVIYSNSRGATVGLAGLTVLYILLISRNRFRDIVLLGSLTVALMVLAPQEFRSRMGTIQFSREQTEGSAQNRMNLVNAAYRATMDHPLFGLGLNCWILVAERYAGDPHEPHNAWLKTSVEIGVPGLMIYAIIVLVTWGRLFRLRSQARADSNPRVSALAVCLILSTAGFVLPSTFLNHPFSEFLWAQMALANVAASRYQDWATE